MDNAMLGEALRQIGGPLKDLFEKLAGSEGMIWLSALKRFLRKENPWAEMTAFFPHTITLGFHKTVEAYTATLELASLQVRVYARQMLAKTPISQTKITLDLVALTTKVLTGKDSATITEVFAGAERFGFDKCPAEVGLACRLADNDQPKGEGYLIGMEPIADASGDPSVFLVEDDDDSWYLDSNEANPDSVYAGDVRWVFCRRK